MRHQSLKRAALMAEAGPWRADFCGEIGRCEVCLKQRLPKDLCCHEIPRGNGRRQKALMAPFAILVVCREPNWRTGVDCHASIQNEPEAKQLARLYLVRSADFQIQRYNELVNPRAPNRITTAEVLKEVDLLLECCSVFAKITGHGNANSRIPKHQQDVGGLADV